MTTTTLVDVHRGSESGSLNNNGMFVSTSLGKNLHDDNGPTVIDDDRNDNDDDGMMISDFQAMV